MKAETSLIIGNLFLYLIFIKTGCDLFEKKLPYKMKNSPSAATCATHLPHSQGKKWEKLVNICTDH